MPLGSLNTFNKIEESVRPIVTKRIELNSLAIAVTDGNPGYGTSVIGALPAYNFLFLGAVSNVTFTVAADSQDTMTTNFDGDYAIGTAPDDNGTLSGAEVNIVPSTSLGAATSFVSPRVKGISTANSVIFDNTDGSLELNLNLLIDNAAISGNSDVTATGELLISYIVLGGD